MLGFGQEFKSPLGHHLMHNDHVGMPLDASARQNPSVLESEHLGSDLEVVVVVHDRHRVFGCQHGGQQIGDAHRSMASGSSQ